MAVLTASKSATGHKLPSQTSFRTIDQANEFLASNPWYSVNRPGEQNPVTTLLVDPDSGHRHARRNKYTVRLNEDLYHQRLADSGGNLVPETIQVREPPPDDDSGSDGYGSSSFTGIGRSRTRPRENSEPTSQPPATPTPSPTPTPTPGPAAETASQQSSTVSAPQNSDGRKGKRRSLLAGGYGGITDPALTGRSLLGG